MFLTAGALRSSTTQPCARSDTGAARRPDLLHAKRAAACCVVTLRSARSVMRLGIFSDVHDDIANLRKALSIFAVRGIDTGLFLGDFCSPIPARVMGAEFAGELHCVFGNGDGDRFTLNKISTSEFSNLKLHGIHAELTFAGVKLAMTHYPLYGQALARTGDYAAVFSGHTHECIERRFGDCLWLNPGAVLGFKQAPTCAVYDLSQNSAEIISL
jgi:uncharacterized protein